MSLSGAVYINRKNRKDAVRALEQAGDDMKKKGVRSPILFSCYLLVRHLGFADTCSGVAMGLP